jgi:hypothetical protein
MPFTDRKSVISIRVNSISGSFVGEGFGELTVHRIKNPDETRAKLGDRRDVPRFSGRQQFLETEKRPVCLVSPVERSPADFFVALNI